MSAAKKVRENAANDSTAVGEWEWAPPIEQFLGDEEPDDDDAEDWIIRDLIPRAEPFLDAGAWKSGKTWKAIVKCICVALGRPFLGFENTLGRPGRVLLIALEDGRRRLRKRIWQACRGLGVTPNHDLIKQNLRIWDKPIRLPGDAKDRQRFIDELNRWKPDVVLIDSLSRAMIGSQNDIKDAAAFTAAWRDITIATGASVGFLHHTNKIPGGDQRGDSDPFDKIRGSGELLAAPRNLILMERLGGDDSKVSAVRMRGNLELERSSFALEWEQSTTADGKIAVTLTDRGSVEEILAEMKAAKKEARAEEKQGKQDKTTATALKIARDRGACSSTTLAVVLAIHERTAARHLKVAEDAGLLTELGADGRAITESGRTWLVERGL